MKQPEATFKKQLNESFAAVFPDGWWAYVKALARDGAPDLHYQLSGLKALWVEAKVGTNPLRKSQEREIYRMVAAGARVKVLRLLKDGDGPRQMSIQLIGRCHATEKIAVAQETTVDWNDRANRRFWYPILDL
jgi:hypothetical protein